MSAALKAGATDDDSGTECTPGGKAVRDGFINAAPAENSRRGRVHAFMGSWNRTMGHIGEDIFTAMEE